MEYQKYRRSYVFGSNESAREHGTVYKYLTAEEEIAWSETAYGSKEFFAALHHVETMYNTKIYTLHQIFKYITRGNHPSSSDLHLAHYNSDAEQVT